MYAFALVVGVEFILSLPLKTIISYFTLYCELPYWKKVYIGMYRYVYPFAHSAVVCCVLCVGTVLDVRYTAIKNTSKSSPQESCSPVRIISKNKIL